METSNFTYLNNMKSLLLSAFLLFLANECIAQEGYDLIRLAEKKIAKGKLDRAEVLLDWAAESDYGFCGNAWIEANELITIHRSKIYALRGKYLEAANILNDSMSNWSYNVDCLKMTYYSKAIGREKVYHEMDSLIQQKGGMDEILDYGGEEIEFKTSFATNPINLTVINLYKLGSECEEPESLELKYAEN